MTTRLKLYEVRDGTSYVGTFFARNEDQAIRRALETANAGAGAFRKSWTRITFSDLRAIEVVS